MSDSKVRHVLGISGGKDSAALAIYLNKIYSKEALPLEYYTCDTGRELDETYKLIDELEADLGKPIHRYTSKDHESAGFNTPFDFFLKEYKGYLPSQNARWCTKKMKLEPFEREIGDDLAISYVGIRGDEDREGYISTKPNIQSIFPFRKNIWSLDVTIKVLNNSNREQIVALYSKYLCDSPDEERIIGILKKPVDKSFQMKHKLDRLLNYSVKTYNKVVFEFLKGTEYPIGKLDYFPLIENEDILTRKDIFDIIAESGVNLPSYYEPTEYEVDGEIGKYFRSRSGCFFCFYQQKIEWIWLLEKHKDLYWRAAEYEKDGYAWIQGESLTDLSQEHRVQAVKREHLSRMKRKYENLQTKTDWQNQVLAANPTQLKDLASNSEWLDTIIESESELCANCFI